MVLNGRLVLEWWIGSKSWISFKMVNSFLNHGLDLNHGIVSKWWIGHKIMDWFQNHGLVPESWIGSRIMD